eukprot:TRINITY_DN2339_c0_g2_i1.p1 TRINITY_DN2339_c0_g2~~TRINITY_DN2339_c0_g2_i1.p1  ORF type:complete len:875 (-),score=224.18 TRINITY_DN2339_c0_g2_i1:314-2866(-)
MVAVAQGLGALRAPFAVPPAAVGVESAAMAKRLGDFDATVEAIIEACSKMPNELAMQLEIRTHLAHLVSSAELDMWQKHESAQRQRPQPPRFLRPAAARVGAEKGAGGQRSPRKGLSAAAKVARREKENVGPQRENALVNVKEQERPEDLAKRSRRLSDRERGLAERERALESRETHLEQRQEELVTQSIGLAERVQLKSAAAESERRLHEAEARQRVAEDQLASMREGSGLLQERYRRQEEALATAEAKLREVEKAAAESAAKELRALQDRMATVEEEAARARSAATAQIQELEAELARCASSSAQSLEEQKARAAEAEARCRELQEAVQGALREKELRLAEFEEQRCRLQRIEAAEAEAKAVAQGYTDELHTREDMIVRLQDQVDALRKQAPSLEEVASRTAALEADLAQVKRERDGLADSAQASEERARASRDSEQAALLRAARLEDKVAALEACITTLRTERESIPPAGARNSYGAEEPTEDICALIRGAPPQQPQLPIRTMTQAMDDSDDSPMDGAKHEHIGHYETTQDLVSLFSSVQSQLNSQQRAEPVSSTVKAPSSLTDFLPQGACTPREATQDLAQLLSRAAAVSAPIAREPAEAAVRVQDVQPVKSEPTVPSRPTPMHEPIASVPATCSGTGVASNNACRPVSTDPVMSWRPTGQVNSVDLMGGEYLCKQLMANCASAKSAAAIPLRTPTPTRAPPRPASVNVPVATAPAGAAGATVSGGGEQPRQRKTARKQVAFVADGATGGAATDGLPGSARSAFATPPPTTGGAAGSSAAQVSRAGVSAGQHAPTSKGAETRASSPEDPGVVRRSIGGSLMCSIRGFAGAGLNLLGSSPASAAGRA